MLVQVVCGGRSKTSAWLSHHARARTSVISRPNCCEIWSGCRPGFLRSGLMRDRRCVLILDDLESLFEPAQREGRYPGGSG